MKHYKYTDIGQLMNQEEIKITAITSFATHLVSVIGVCHLIGIGSIWGPIAILTLSLSPCLYKIWKEWRQ